MQERMSKQNKKHLLLISIVLIVALIAVTLLAVTHGYSPRSKNADLCRSAINIDDHMVIASLPLIFFGILFIFTGLTVLLISIVKRIGSGRYSTLAQGIAFFAFSVVSGAYIIFNSGGLVLYIFKNQELFVCFQRLTKVLIIPAGCWHFSYRLNEKKGQLCMRLGAAVMALLVGVSVVLSSSRLELINYFQIIILLETLEALIAGICFSYECMIKKQKDPYLFVMLYLPIFVCILLKNFRLENISIFNLIITSLEIIFVFLVQLYSLLQLYKAHTARNLLIYQLENKLADNRIMIMLSQIQPHFLYNALSTIQALCKTDPEKAAAATNHLSKYLRINMDSLKMSFPVMFKIELNHLKNYLYIEKLRYGERLNIEFDIQEVQFRLPILTVQPLVENAIKHGISISDRIGKVRVSTRKTTDCIEITISDNGVGFDTQAVIDKKAHIGLENVKKRLCAMCGGSLEVVSEIGIGTTAVIRIPND